MSENIPWQNRPPILISAVAVLLIILALAFLSTGDGDSAHMESENASGTEADRLHGGLNLGPLKPIEPTVHSAGVEAEDSAETLPEVDEPVAVTIVVDGQPTSLQTHAQTVGEALRQAGIVVESGDLIAPEPSDALTPDLEIVVKRASPLAIRVDGRVVYTTSHFSSVADVLAQVGVTLEGQDYAFPGPDHQLRPGDTIQVTRVTEELRFEETPIPYETIWQGVDDLELDQRVLISAGAPGMVRRQFRVRLEDGVRVGETFEGESIVQEPVNEVMGYGTRINVRVLETPEGPVEYWRVVRMRVTAYTAASSGKPPDHPTYGITASGLEAGTGIVAIDPKVVPFRSWVYVPGYGLGFAGDTGGGIKGRWIDLGYDEDEILAWSGYVDVFYLAPAPPPDDINYLIPSELP